MLFNYRGGNCTLAFLWSKFDLQWLISDHKAFKNHLCQFLFDCVPLLD